MFLLPCLAQDHFIISLTIDCSNFASAPCRANHDAWGKPPSTEFELELASGTNVSGTLRAPSKARLHAIADQASSKL